MAKPAYHLINIEPSSMNSSSVLRKQRTKLRGFLSVKPLFGGI